MVSPQLKAHFESMDVPLIPLEVGAKMLVDEIAGSAPTQVELVLGGEPRPEALLQRSAPQSNPQAGPQLTPHSGTPSNGRSFSVDIVVGKDTHPYLADHAIKGTPVVPVAMVIEWFSRTAKAFGPEQVLTRLLDLKVLRGISLQDFPEGRRCFVVHCRQLTNGSGATLALELANHEGDVYYRCSAELAPQRGNPQPHTGDLQDLALEPWGDEVVYDGELLFHGPAFQMIRNITGISEHGIVAELSGVEGCGWESERAATQGTGENGRDELWSTDPLASDGGLQLALLWCKHVLGGASLPTGIEEIRTWADAPVAGPIRCTLTGRTANGRRSVSDLAFHDARGSLLTEFVGVETHLLSGQGADRVQV
jgi:hypothetical protein